MLSSHGEGQSLVLDSNFFFFLTWMPIISAASEAKPTGKCGIRVAENNININILWFLSFYFCIVYNVHCLYTLSFNP